ncbi:MAG: hypothetical protein WBI82_00340 [Sphaerochaeta sp.]
MRSDAVRKKFTTVTFDAAHKATVFHEKDIMNSSVCTCFYCGYQFDPQEERNLVRWDKTNPKGHTLVCSKCGIDCIVEDAAEFPFDRLSFHQSVY